MRGDSSGDSSGSEGSRQIEAVLFDFHGTLAQVEPLTRSVELAARTCRVDLSAMQITALADAVGAHGWVGSGQPARVRPHFAQEWADRDLSEADHRAAFIGIAEQAHGAFDGFAEALYERMCAPDGWVPYTDTIATLTELRERDIPVALVSNIGFDVRPVVKYMGFDDLIDHWILSFEVGYCKPDPRIFHEACLKLEIAPQQALMVGDSLADAGAAELGCRTYLLPHTGPGEPVGLDAVLRLVDC